jgi:hypothetical protein
VLGGSVAARLRTTASEQGSREKNRKTTREKSKHPARSAAHAGLRLTQTDRPSDGPHAVKVPRRIQLATGRIQIVT